MLVGHSCYIHGFFSSKRSVLSVQAKRRSCTSPKDRIKSMRWELQIKICAHHRISDFAGNEFHPNDDLVSARLGNEVEFMQATASSDGEQKSFMRCNSCRRLGTRTGYASVAEEFCRRDRRSLEHNLEICHDLGALKKAPILAGNIIDITSGAIPAGRGTPGRNSGFTSIS
jgi:hypothetical protein